MTTQRAPTARDAPPATGAASSPRPLMSVHAIERGQDVELRNALVGGAIGERVSITRALVRHAYGGGSFELRQAGAAVVATAGGATIDRGGAQAILSAGTVTMHRAGAGAVIARSVEIDQGGTVLLAITPRIEVHGGGRVLVGTGAALAAAGLLTALVAGVVLAARRRTPPAT